MATSLRRGGMRRASDSRLESSPFFSRVLSEVERTRSNPGRDESCHAGHPSSKGLSGTQRKARTACAARSVLADPAASEQGWWRGRGSDLGAAVLVKVGRIHTPPARWRRAGSGTRTACACGRIPRRQRNPAMRARRCAPSAVRRHRPVTKSWKTCRRRFMSDGEEGRAPAKVDVSHMRGPNASKTRRGVPRASSSFAGGPRRLRFGSPSRRRRLYPSATHAIARIGPTSDNEKSHLKPHKWLKPLQLVALGSLRA